MSTVCVEEFYMNMKEGGGAGRGAGSLQRPLDLAIKQVRIHTGKTRNCASYVAWPQSLCSNVHSPPFCSWHWLTWARSRDWSLDTWHALSTNTHYFV